MCLRVKDRHKGTHRHSFTDVGPLLDAVDIALSFVHRVFAVDMVERNLLLDHSFNLDWWHWQFPLYRLLPIKINLAKKRMRFQLFRIIGT